MVTIILPAFNEAEGIGELIEHIGASLSAIEGRRTWDHLVH
ncbi:MAG: hypothetical protein VYA69_13870 [Gemmatimonadota bacterium]|uniref:Uncharacterized protein n=1 Tax=marine metagenome TaxID=408172 RepID=A0A382IM10_9ZZZZ|nr:hypothetical protein [Gemmatimonadota bacterium]